MYGIVSISPLLERVAHKVYCDTRKEGLSCMNDHKIGVDISGYVVDSRAVYPIHKYIYIAMFDKLILTMCPTLGKSTSTLILSMLCPV